MSALLQGRKIIVTRDENGASYFAKKIQQNGGIAIEIPLLTITCDDPKDSKHILERLHDYQWLFFTSANGVECFFRLLSKYHIPLKTIEKLKIAVVGHKTEYRLKQFGFSADFTPTTYNADTMAMEFISLYTNPGKVLLVRGNLSRTVLPTEFSKMNIPYDGLQVYKTIVNHANQGLLHAGLQREYDFITFTSPSAVDAFCTLTDVSIDKPCVCIGTTTELRAKELGFSNIITPATDFTIDAMIECMIEYIKVRRNNDGF